MKKRALKAKSSEVSAVETYHLVLPSHANALGSIFGGTIMSWIDIAAAICAQRHSEKICVTASIDALHFISPIEVGDSVHLKARVVFTGKSSMMIEVRAEHENVRSKMKKALSALAYLTFVALDEKRRPTPVPPLQVVSAKEHADFEAAKKRRASLIAQRQNTFK
jgi:acyl-CoA hydrolase